jgi:catechol 2,3-dioxygenase-like lactoylglutathione lyase family enzyme
MAKAPITRLRYMAVAVPDFDAQIEFYEELWGLRKVEEETDIAFFAAEGSPEPYVLRIRRADEKRVDVMGLGADDAAAVDRLAAELAAERVRFVSEPGALQLPGGGYGFRFFDPDGRVIEVASDVTPRLYREIEPEEAIPRKLSHIVLMSPHAEQTLAFYREKLGFRVSDVILGGLTFMRCTTDHHGVAIGQAANASLNHVAFEVRGIEEQMRATGRLLRAGKIMRSGFLRQYVGDQTSSYFYDPNGNVSEFATPIEQIPLEGGRAPRYVDRSVTPLDVWGTGQYVSQDRVPANSLTPETGQWVAPPV